MLIRSAKSLASRSHRWRRACAVLAIPAALIAWSKSASAQGWLADRKYAQGAGIRTGDLELHPGIGGEVGYDSNWFMRSSKSGPTIANGDPKDAAGLKSGGPADAAVLRLTPSFYVQTLGAERVEGSAAPPQPRTLSFRGGISATGRALIGKGVSSQSNVGLASDARLDINQGRPVGFGVFGGWSRIIQPQVLGAPDLSFIRDDLRAGAELAFLPGGGTLDLRGGYMLNAVLFEDSGGVPFSNLTHEVTVKNRWRFRPRTALFHETSLRFINYLNADRSNVYLNDSTPVRTQLGLTGLLTQHFGALLAAGYGATFFANPAAPSSTQYNGFTGQAEGTFYLGQGGADEPGQATLLLSSVSLGFLRSFQNSYLGNFATSNRGYGRLEYWFGGRVLLTFNVYGEQLSYPPVFANTNTGIVQRTGDFSNFRLGGSLFAEYRLTQALGINTTIDYLQQLSDTQIPTGTPFPGGAAGQQFVFDQNYNRLQAFAGVRYFY